MAEPLYKLTKRNVPFQWTEINQQVIDPLKERLVMTTALRGLDLSTALREVRLNVVASGIDWRCTLSQLAAPGHYSQGFLAHTSGRGLFHPALEVTYIYRISKALSYLGTDYRPLTTQSRGHLICSGAKVPLRSYYLAYLQQSSLSPSPP